MAQFRTSSYVQPLRRSLPLARRARSAFIATGLSIVCIIINSLSSFQAHYIKIRSWLLHITRSSHSVHNLGANYRAVRPRIPESPTDHGILPNINRGERRRKRDIRRNLANLARKINGECAHMRAPLETPMRRELKMSGFSSAFGTHRWTAKVPSG